MNKRTWCFMDLVTGPDGKMVLTKLQAACFHLALFVTVCWITYRTELFSEAMWGLYAMVAVGHAVVDKTAAQVSGYKNAQLESVSSPAPSFTETKVVQTTSTGPTLPPQ